MEPTRLEIRHPRWDLNGHPLEDLVLSGCVYGAPLGTAPVTMLCGGITASPLPFGGEGQEPWWSALHRPGLVDPARETVLCPALPGNGSHWTGLADASVLPALSVLDLADLVAAWMDGIGCDQPVRYIGASLGGLLGLALAARHPERVDRLVSISAGLRPDGWGTGVRHLQRAMVLQGLRSGQVQAGMSHARQLGMLTYRGREELNTRFGAMTPDEEHPPVAGYLEHNGAKFAERFSPATFLLLSEAIDRCHLASTASGVREVLSGIQARVAVVGVPGDLLFPWALQQELYRELSAAGVPASLWKLDSVYGHDAFLADQDRLAEILPDTGLFDEAPTTAHHDVGIVPVREIRLGLVGCGVVGQGLLELLDLQQDSLRERYNVRFDVVHVAVRNLDTDRGPHAAGLRFTTDPMEVVSDPAVDAVVEVAGGIEAMEPVLRAALAAGKPVVTANKELLAAQLGELAILAHRTATPLGCEAAAAAALPIIRALSHRADEVRGLMGIVNGTNNFLLTRMEQDEQSFEDAVRTAQTLGLAEADPSADIEGHDAAAKLSILAYRSFGHWVPPAEIPTRGLLGLTTVDTDLAGAMGFRIRHVCRARRRDGGLELAVEPLLLPDWHLLAGVEEEYNAVYLEMTHSGDLSFFGKGAGGLPTAASVLGDLIDLAQDNSARWPAPSPVNIVATRPRRHYLRLTASAHPTLARRLEGQLRRADLTVQNRASHRVGDVVHLGFLTSPCTSEQASDLCAQLTGLGRVSDGCWLGVFE